MPKLSRKQASKKLDKVFGKVPRDASAAISRMPRKVRDAVSNAILDGADWRKVAAICSQHGFPGVNAQNVTNYRKGAHQEWIAKQERLEAIQRDSETTGAVIRHYAEYGGSPAEAGLLAASEIMARALNGLGPEALQVLMADDPKALFGITRELARVAEMLRARKPDAAEEKPADDKPAITPEQRAAAMKEIFGLPT